MQKKDVKLGPWPKGLDNVSQEDVANLATRRLTNARLTADGWPRAVRVGDPAPADVLRQAGGFTLRADGTLELYGQPATTSDPRAVFMDYDGTVGVAFTADTAWIEAAGASRELPRARPVVMAGPEQPGEPARNIIAINDGLPSVPVTVQGTPPVSATSGALYATRPDGAEFYALLQQSSGYTLGALLPDGEHLMQPMYQPIDSFTVFRAGCAIGRGGLVWVSPPGRPHIVHPTSFLTFGQRVVLVAGLEEMLYVGTEGGLFVVAGYGTDRQEVRKVASARPLSYSFVRVPAGVLDNERPLVAFATESGVVLGDATGRVTVHGDELFHTTGPQGGLLTLTDRTFYYIPRA